MSSRFFEIQELLVPCQYIREHPGATRNGDDNEALSLSVKKYTPLRRTAGRHAVTILAAGGCGFPKELYEPLWEDLLVRSNDKLDGKVAIKAIWIADMAHQGASGHINKERLGLDSSVHDHARDLLQLVSTHRSEFTQPIVGIGHSMGAAALLRLSLLHSRLLATILCFDPTLGSSRGDLTLESLFYAHHCAQRPDHWPSRDKAKEHFSRTPLQKEWEPRVFERWITHGLTASTQLGTTVTLTTSRDQEIATYVRPILNPRVDLHPDTSVSASFEVPASAEIFLQLPFLRPPIVFISGAKSAIAPPHRLAEWLDVTGTAVGGSGGRTRGKVQSRLLPDRGHLFPFEIPDTCAEIANEALEQGLEAYKTDKTSSANRHSLAMVNAHGSLQVSEQWKALMKKDIKALTAAKARL